MHRSLLALAFAALSAPAFANAVITEFPGSGLVFKEAVDIAIDREDLFIGREKVTVHYDYRSDASQVQSVTIGFPMPAVPIDGGPSDPANLPELEGKDVLNYMQFGASVNGVPVETTLHQFAWLEGKDVTADLTALGIPTYLAYEDIESAFAGIDAAALDALEAAGLISRDAERTYVSPNWMYQSVYEWRQDFAPGVTKVDISYSPLAGYPGDIGDVYETDDYGTYCVDDSIRATIADNRARGILYEVSTLGYVTTTATYWKGPIGSFNLTIAKEPLNAGNGLVATEMAFCGRPDFTETPDSFTWSAADFVPVRDIAVVWYFFYDY
jgi:hypothetical protein